MKLIQANAFQIPLPDKSVHMCVTSSPYYSLRKYAGEQEFIFGGDEDCVHEFEAHERYHGAPVGKSKTRWQHTDGGSPKTHPEQYEVGQAGTKRVSVSAYCSKCNAWRGAYGLEPTLQMYIDHTVEWCREVWRVLRDDGTFWCNLGDSCSGGGRGGHTEEKKSENWQPDYPRSVVPDGLKPKDLMGIPWRVALALQADGWYLRSDIIWHKPNPMPESVTDRPTKAHEYLFLLTKNKTYYYDQDAIREEGAGRLQEQSYHNPTNSKYDSVPHERWKHQFDDRVWGNPAGRNRRSVWIIATIPYSGAHFATFPPALIEPCIKAGTSEKGVCPECGNPWERVLEKTAMIIRRSERTHELGRTRSSGTMEEPATSTTLGWRPVCGHYDDAYRAFPRVRSARKKHQQDIQDEWFKRVRKRPLELPLSHNLFPSPAIVLDPFIGSGTTLIVARKHGRHGIGLDISMEYLDLAKERLGLKALEEWENGKPGETDYEGLPMFEAQVDE